MLFVFVLLGLLSFATTNAWQYTFTEPECLLGTFTDHDGTNGPITKHAGMTCMPGGGIRSDTCATSTWSFGNIVETPSVMNLTAEVWFSAPFPLPPLLPLFNIESDTGDSILSFHILYEEPPPLNETIFPLNAVGPLFQIGALLSRTGYCDALIGFFYVSVFAEEEYSNIMNGMNVSSADIYRISISFAQIPTQEQGLGVSTANINGVGNTSVAITLMNFQDSLTVYFDKYLTDIPHVLRLGCSRNTPDAGAVIHMVRLSPYMSDRTNELFDQY